MTTQEVKEKLEDIRGRAVEIRKIYKRSMAPLILEEKEVFKNCPHEWKMLPNPAGERTEYQCEICFQYKDE